MNQKTVQKSSGKLHQKLLSVLTLYPIGLRLFEIRKNSISKIVQAVLIGTAPAIIAHPTGEISSSVIQQANYHPIQLPDLRNLSYNQVIDLLALIESDAFDERYSENELDQINQFISFLAIEGATKDEKFDIENATAALFRKDAVEYAIFTNSGSDYSTISATYGHHAPGIIVCKSWFKKQWDQTRSFVKKHKKAIIIGTIVVVTVAVVVVAAVAISSSAASAATAAAGGALASSDPSTNAATESSHSKSDGNNYSAPKETPPDESLSSSWQQQVSLFKETVAKEQFSAASESNGITLEENGRIIGSLFAHQTMESLAACAANNPSIAAELKDLGFNSQYPTPQWQPIIQESSTISPHYSTDLAFSTDYRMSYAGNFGDLNALSYQARGDLALNSEYYHQALQDFGKAISLNPDNPILYLERGIANFELGNYEDSIADYSQYIEKKGEPFSVTDFSIGFAKGVPKGAYESGKGALLFLTEFIAHPVQSSKQVVDALSQLATLVKNDEYGVVAEALSPELHQLVTQWDTLPSETRGDLAGYAVGKLGTDLIGPGAVVKVASKSVNSAKELVAICKNIQIAHETLILETASGIGIPAKVSEIVEMGKKAASLGEDLGFTSQEIGQLQKAGNLETTVANACEHLSPSMKESLELFNKAQKFLKPYKGFMSESQARKLIHQAGIKTFPRPQGIPDNFKIKISDKGAGMKYVHPTDEGTYVRVMPGKPHSPNPSQQKPYITHLKNDTYLDKHGKKVSRDDPAAHISLDEFIYRN